MFLLAGIVTMAICFVSLTSGVHAKEELDEVEKELANALEHQGKSNLNTMYKRDNGDPCEEECADISDDSTLREVGECMACLCGIEPSLDICDDDDNDDDDDKRGQPESIVRKIRLPKKRGGWPFWMRKWIWVTHYPKAG